MKLKRLLACALTLTLSLSMWTVPVAAASYPDAVGHWAEDYIDDMTNQGLFKGYEDNTFRPNNELTVAEGLALCARSLFLDESITSAVGAQRADEVEDILGTRLSWFHQDFAVCLELGVVSNAELTALASSGALTEAIEKEKFSLYLVRAIGLESLALSLQSYSMNFADVNDIGQTYRPYIYVLNTYGIVEGTEENKFEPQRTVNRATSATMLSRVVEFVDDQNIAVEVPDYTEYDWVSGVVTQVSSGANGYAVSLESGGEMFHVTVGSKALVYQNNMPMSAVAIKENMFARMALDEDDTVTEVRLVAATSMSNYSGDVYRVSGDSLVLEIGSTHETFTINRFTRVMVGGNVGDRTLIDGLGAYTNAVCTVDAVGTVLTMTLSGGISEKTGILHGFRDGEGSDVIVQLSNFDGSVQEYTLPSTVAVKENNLSTTLKSGQIGFYVALGVSNDQLGTITEMYINSNTAYLQGEVLGVNYVSYPTSIYVRDYRTGASKTYELAEDSMLTYEGKDVALRDVEKNWFVTAKCDVYGDLATLEFYGGSITVSGVLTSVSYGGTTTINVQDEQGNTYSFQLDMSDLPVFIRDGVSSSVDKLRMGDTVEVSVLCNEVERISSYSQAATVTGTIERVVQESGGTTMEVRLSDMTYVSYTLLTTTTVTEDGATVSQNVLVPDMQVGLVVNDGELLSVDIQGRGESQSGEMKGTVLYVDASAKTIMMRVTKNGVDNIITVKCSSSTRVLTVGGTTIGLNNLEADDSVVLYGSYSGSDFVVTVILRN